MTLTSTGLQIKRLDEIVEEMGTDARLVFGPTTNTAPDSVLGQLIGTFAKQLAEVWELAQQLYDSFDPDQAEGEQLRNLCALSGVTPIPARATQGSVRATGLAGTLIPSGSVLENSTTLDRYQTLIESTIAATTLVTGTLTFDSADDSVTRTAGSWNADGVVSGTRIVFSNTASNNITREVDAVISATKITLTNTVTNETAVSPVATIGRATIPVAALETGPLQCLAFDLDTIIDTRSGWHTVTNTIDLINGQSEESDPELRIRREESLNITGSGVDFAIRARLRQLDNVLQALVISNRSESTDSEGRPMKSFECILWPDLADSTYRESIVRTIFENQPAGMKAYGLINYTVSDAQGYAQNVGFSFANGITLYVSCDLDVDENYPADGDDQVKQALLDQGNALSVGDDVLVWKFTAALKSIPGIVDIDLKIDTLAIPVNTANIVIAHREIAQFDSGRITVASVVV